MTVTVMHGKQGAFGIFPALLNGHQASNPDQGVFHRLRQP